MSAAHPDPQTGSALLEAIIAIAILGIASTAILSAVSQSADQAKLSEETIAASSLAARLLDEAQTLPAGQTVPDAQGAVGAFIWRRSIQPAQDIAVTGYTESPARLYRVAITVGWDHGGRERQVRLDTLAADVPDAR